jgi:amino acid adenylation domain-containing protein
MEPVTCSHADDKALDLSASQREVWLDQRAWPGSTHLYIGGVAYLEGALDVARLLAALDLLVGESDALRLVPHENGSQTLLETIALPIEVSDLPLEADLHDAANAWWTQKIQQPFAWDGSPPWRFAVLRGVAGRHAIVMQYHHLVMDGWGTALLIQRWSALYNGLMSREETAPSTAASYGSFIADSTAYAKSPAFLNDGQYWLTQMPVLEPVLIDRNTSTASPGLPAACMGHVSVPIADYEELKSCAAQHNSTAFNYFLAAMVVYFSRTTNRQTVVLGVPSLNRVGRRYRDTLGMFVGVFPVSVTVTPDMTVGALLAAIGLIMRGALRHARYPLSEMGRALKVMQHGRDGLFDVLLSFERQDYNVAFGNARMEESRQLFCGKARYPLSVTVCEFQSDQDLEIVLEGSSACFESLEITRLGQRIWHLVRSMMATSATPLDALPLLNESQQAQVQSSHPATVWHDETTPYIAQFESQSRLTPENVALVWDGGTMTYAELEQRANRLAHRLAAMGAGPEKVVAIAIHRSADLVVAILAVSKAGAAFLPLDPDAPLARLSDILDEGGAMALVIQEHSLERLAPVHPRIVFATWHDAVADDAPSPLPTRVPPEAVAYILFTSGSTGRPKGVMIEHASLSRRLLWLSRAYGIGPEDRSALGTQITFDPSLIELCLPLIAGASVALPPPGRLLPETLADFAIRHAVTLIAFVPSTLTRFLDRAEGQPNLKLRVACCGGEVLPADLVNRYLKGTRARLFNVYGPTEACIFATAWECVNSPTGSALPLGLPVDDTCIYVLDANCLPVPLGVPGEVFIGGTALARGYVNRPDLDNEAFLPDPFRPGARMYRTGDRGWLAEDGNLHFLGRLDRQIKLRGYRIELGEIEAALLDIEGVTQAAVKVLRRKDKPVLHAWVATSSAHGADTLQRLLRVRLPDYMIPGGISVLPEIPVTINGKTDYASLLEPSVAFAPQEVRQAKNDLERQVLAVWEDVLDVRPLGVQDNFFDVGGDSLAAVTILASVEKIVGVPVPLFLLTENPTVEQLAQALQQPIAAPSSVVSLSAPSNRVPIFIAASGHGDLMRFQALADALQDSCDVRMLQPPVAPSFTTVAQLASFYADLIESQGVLPGFVAGFSVGGIAALETACALQKRSLPIQGLVLIDTLYPRAMWGGTLFWRLFVWFVKTLRLGALTMNGRRLDAMVNDAALVGQVMAMAGYRPQAFSGRSLLIKTSGLARWDWLFFAPWRKLLKNRLSERITPGLHGSIFESKQVTALAALLRDAVSSSWLPK